MSSNRLLITTNTPLRCQFTARCLQSTTNALIETNGLRPVRFMMTPVCPNCLGAAIAEMSDTTRPKEFEQCQKHP